MSQSNLKLDALYTIFEKHLYDFEDNEESQQAFIGKIVQDYLDFLSEHGAVVPRKWQPHIFKELEDQVLKMLVKKMYGCLSIKDFMRDQTDRSAKRKHAQKKYSKIR